MTVQLRRLGPRTQTLILNTSESNDSVWITGRGSECDVHARSKFASRKHFSISLRNNTYILKDYGSANGTYINEKKIDSKGEYLLEIGTLIGVGVPASFQNNPECFVFIFELVKVLDELKIEEDLMETNSRKSIPAGINVSALCSTYENDEKYHKRAKNMKDFGLQTENRNYNETTTVYNEIQENQKRLYAKAENSSVAKYETGSFSIDMCNKGDFFGTSVNENITYHETKNLTDVSAGKNLKSYSLEEEPIEIIDSEDEWPQASIFKNEPDNSGFFKSGQDYVNDDDDDDDDDDLFIDCIVHLNKSEGKSLVTFQNDTKGNLSEFDKEEKEELIKSDRKCNTSMQSFQNNSNNCEEISEEDRKWISLIKNFADEIDQVLNFDEKESADSEAVILDEEMANVDDDDDDIMIIHTKLKDEFKQFKSNYNTDADIEVIEETEISESNNRHKNENCESINSENKRMKRKKLSKADDDSYNNDIEIVSPIPPRKKRRVSFEEVKDTVKREQLRLEPDVLIIRNLKHQNSCESLGKKLDKEKYEDLELVSEEKNKIKAAADSSTLKNSNWVQTIKSFGNEEKESAYKNVSGIKAQIKVVHNNPNVSQSNRMEKVLRTEDNEKSNFNEDSSKSCVNKVFSNENRHAEETAKFKSTSSKREASTEAKRKCNGPESAILHDFGNKPMSYTNINSDKDGNLRYRKIFYDILNWNANWLEESKNIPSCGLPPIFQSNLLQSVQRTFHSHYEYMNAFIPLLSLELWHSLSEKWKFCNSLVNKRPAVCKSYETLEEDTVYQFGVIGCDCVISVADNDMLWSKGNIVVIQINRTEIVKSKNLQQNGKTKKVSYYIFGYIVKKIVKFLDSDDTHPVLDKLRLDKNSTKIVKLDILVKNRPQLAVYVNTLTNLIPLHQMSAEKDLFNAVCSLHRSPLLYTILMPDRSQIALPAKVDRENIFFNGPLNCKQQELIWKLFHLCNNKSYGLAQIEGGPGTGKTYTIIAFVLQLLYSKTLKDPLRPKILYCSHSEVVVDEFTLKLNSCIQNLSGSTEKYKIVRFGNMCYVRPSVRSMCSAHLAKEFKSNENVSNEIKLLDNKIRALNASLKTPNTLTIAEIKRKNIALCELIKNREMVKNSELSTKLQKESFIKAENDILEKADVISTTCFSSGAKKMIQVFKKIKSLASERKIICIIDGAMQCKEAEAIIPLQHGVTHLIMLGDSRQLRATTKNEIVHSLGGNQSLFWRMSNIFNKTDATPSPIYKLKIQYRMHPSISFLPKKIYYSDNLLDGIRNNHSFGLEEYLLLIFGRICKDSANKSESLYPYDMILTLMNLLLDFINQKNKDCSLALITCDYEKTKLLKSKLSNSHTSRFEILPIEYTSGREFDIVVFIFDDKMTCGYKANVALTRAKKSLIVLTSDRPNKSNKFLERLVSDAIVRGFMKPVKPQVGNSELARLIFKS